MSSKDKDWTELEDVQSTIDPSAFHEHFFAAVRKGDAHTVQYYIDKNLVDLNYIDSNGQTALQVAVSEDHIAIVHLLVNNGALIGNALLDAINTNSLQSVSVLAPLHKERSKQYLRSSSKVERSVDVVLPPLVLAAQKNEYEIIKLLLNEGEEIQSPHEKYCDCDVCEDLGQLGTYLLHLNTYRALVSPEFIALEFLLQKDQNKLYIEKDPLYRLFVLKKEILFRANTEYEFRDDYVAQANKCENFAVGILDQCRNLEEISAIMSLPGIKDLSGGAPKETIRERKPNLSILNFALKNKNNKFIAHRFSQVMLNSVFYTGVKGFEENNYFLSTFLVFLYWLAMPLFMLIYQLTPTNRWTRMLEIPIVKFLSHVGSWVWFLVILVVAAFETKITKRKDTDVQVIDAMIGIWIAGMIVEEIKQLSRLGRNTYFTQWWRVVAALVCLSFFVTGILWVADFGILAEEKGTVRLNITAINDFQGDILRQTIRMSSHTFYTLGVLLAFCQISHNFQVSYYLGPLHITLMNMAGDVVKFIFIFGTAYIAFAIGLKELYSWYESTAKVQAGNGDFSHQFDRLDGSFRYLFWSLFQDIDTDTFKTDRRYDKFGIIQYAGEVMFALYCVVAILVALNLLIAMLTNTFNKVGGDQDTSFKVNRTRILMQYVNQGSVTPAPMNLIPFRYILSCIYNKCKNCIGVKPVYTPQLRMRNKVMRTLLHRYLTQRKTEKGQKSDRETSESPNGLELSAL